MRIGRLEARNRIKKVGLVPFYINKGIIFKVVGIRM